MQLAGHAVDGGLPCWLRCCAGLRIWPRAWEKCAAVSGGAMCPWAGSAGAGKGCEKLRGLAAFAGGAKRLCGRAGLKWEVCGVVIFFQRLMRAMRGLVRGMCGGGRPCAGWCGVWRAMRGVAICLKSWCAAVRGLREDVRDVRGLAEHARVCSRHVRGRQAMCGLVRGLASHARGGGNWFMACLG